MHGARTTSNTPVFFLDGRLAVFRSYAKLGVKYMYIVYLIYLYAMPSLLFLTLLFEQTYLAAVSSVAYLLV